MKTKIDKDLANELKRRHEQDWDYGPGWGAATCTTYKTRRYFSKELSQRIISEAARLHAIWKAKLNKIPASKRYAMVESSIFWKSWDIIPELKRACHYDFDRGGNAECRIEGVAVPGNEPEKPLAIYVQCLTQTLKKYKGNYTIKPVSDDPAKLCLKIARRDADTFITWPSGNFGRLKQEIFWDPECEQFYCLYETNVSTKEIPESARRRNWARKRKHNEFFGLIKDLQKTLLEAGIQIVGLERDRWNDVTGIKCIYPTEIA